jgi:hypothetical protein
VKTSPPTSADSSVSAAPPATKDQRASDAEAAFKVSLLMHLLGGLVHRYPRWWLKLGRLETNHLGEALAPVAVRMPIYVCGLARAGSTLLHEVVSAPAGVATHRAKDYPLIFTPYWGRRAAASKQPSAPQPRAHNDGMMISTESPDALEEMLWMAFFPRCHDPAVSCCLAREDSHPEFESFYNAHLRKLLLVEGATRYTCKNNYHSARLPYLLRLFPDAKFIIPVRSPASHIASLKRQQLWFTQEQGKYPRALAFMQRSGHFEFGLDRRPMNLGDGPRVQRIQEAWAAGEEVRGLAMYWDMVYGYLADLLDSDREVLKASRVVRFDSLCAAPAQTLQEVLDHCQLSDSASIVARFAPGIRVPTYYSSGFSARDLEVIHTETAATAKRWGFDTNR